MPLVGRCPRVRVDRRTVARPELLPARLRRWPRAAARFSAACGATPPATRAERACRRLPARRSCPSSGSPRARRHAPRPLTPSAAPARASLDVRQGLHGAAPAPASAGGPPTAPAPTSTPAARRGARAGRRHEAPRAERVRRGLPWCLRASGEGAGPQRREAERRAELLVRAVLLLARASGQHPPSDDDGATTTRDDDRKPGTHASMALMTVGAALLTRR